MSSRGERAAGPALPAPADVLLSDGSVAVIRRSRPRRRTAAPPAARAGLGRELPAPVLRHRASHRPRVRRAPPARLHLGHRDGAGRPHRRARHGRADGDRQRRGRVPRRGRTPWPGHGQPAAGAPCGRGTPARHRDVRGRRPDRELRHAERVHRRRLHLQASHRRRGRDRPPRHRETSTSTAAADARDRRAESRSLHPLLYPSSVAVLGVRRDGSGIGRAVLDSIQRGGFTGELCVVHPEGTRDRRRAVYSRLDEVPDPWTWPSSRFRRTRSWQQSPALRTPACRARW